MAPSEPNFTPEHVAEMLRETRETVRAPASLRARVEARRPRPVRRRVQRARLGLLAGAASAVIILALALVLPGGTPGSPSLSEAAALALKGSTAPAPGPDRGSGAAKLHANVEEIYFPDWGWRLGWRAVGQRTDHLGGRLAITVFYARRGRTIAYTIISAPALAQPAARVSRMHGTVLRTLRLDGRTVVTWRRQNHTCVLSGAGVSSWALAELASWRA